MNEHWNGKIVRHVAGPLVVEGEIISSFVHSEHGLCVKVFNKYHSSPVIWRVADVVDESGKPLQ